MTLFCRSYVPRHRAFVATLALSDLGFEHARAADTGRPGYDPRDLLKLYLYGYLNQVRSSRRLEAECHRNVELMWLLGRLYPDKCISEFRRMHSEAMTAAGTALIRFARSCGLFRGEWIAIVCSIAAGLLLRSFWSVFAGTASTGSHIGI